ncbi:hypothetical protein EK21DRAFT_55359, partial [Setomelanomma holmii]
WDKALCKGAKLHQAMLKNQAQAHAFVRPVRSPWDGDLVAEFRTWGYKEVPGYRAELCDFGKDVHVLQRAFGELGISTLNPADGGPNTCYHVEHKDGPTVKRDKDRQLPNAYKQYCKAGSRTLRETQGFTTLGINTEAGALLLPQQDTSQASSSLRKKDLPDLASSSDHAWGFWARAHAGGDTANINKIFACMITNDITKALIDEAIRTYPLPPGTDPNDRPQGVGRWPGITFGMDTDAAKVLLAAGYFLAQHKHRFGKSKSTSKVQVFRPDKGMMAYLLFRVVNTPAVASVKAAELQALAERNRTLAGEMGARKEAQIIETRIVTRSTDGKNVIREHVYRAKL